MGWDRMVQTPDEVEREVGRVADEGTRGKLRSAIRALNDRGFAFWWDKDNAEGWLRHAQSLVSAEAERAIDALPSYEAQCGKVVEAWQALGHVYRALDLPYSSDAVLRAVLDRDHDGVESSSADTEHKAWATRVDRTAYRGTDDYRVTIHHRLAFVADNTVHTAFLHEGEQGTSYWTRHYDTRATPRGAWSWRTYAWHSECQARGGFLGGGDCRTWHNRLFPAAFWYFEQVREVVTKIAAQGLLVTAILARRYALLSNLRVATALGIYRPTTTDRDGVSALAGRGDYDAEEARSRAPETVTDGLDALGTGAELIASVPGAQLVGGFLAVGVTVMRTLVSALESSGALAAQRLVDRFGRRGVIVREPLSRALREAYGVGAPDTLPVVRTFEAGALTGTAGGSDDDRPVHALAPPPSRTVPLLGVAYVGLPTTGTGAGPAPQLAENLYVGSPVGETVARADLYQESKVWRGVVQASKTRPDETPPGGGAERPPASSAGHGWVVAGVVGVVAAVVAVVAARRR